MSVLPASSPLRPRRPRRPPRFFLLSGSESTAEDAEDAEEKRECERTTHYHRTTDLRIPSTWMYSTHDWLPKRRSIRLCDTPRSFSASPFLLLQLYKSLRNDRQKQRLKQRKALTELSSPPARCSMERDACYTTLAL